MLLFGGDERTEVEDIRQSDVPYSGKVSSVHIAGLSDVWVVKMSTIGQLCHNAYVRGGANYGKVLG